MLRILCAAQNNHGFSLNASMSRMIQRKNSDPTLNSDLSIDLRNLYTYDKFQVTTINASLQGLSPAACTINASISLSFSLFNATYLYLYSRWGARERRALGVTQRVRGIRDTNDATRSDFARVMTLR